MSRRDRLYNYIVNTFGISKELIFEYVDKRIEDILDKHLTSKLDSQRIERLIIDKTVYIVKNGIQSTPNYYGWGTGSFEKLVREAIREEVNRIIDEEYTFSGKLSKDKGK